MGFASQDCEEIQIVVSELASNLIRHASHGTIQLGELRSEDRAGIEIISQDEGPGIADIEQAMTDGYTTSNSLGLGLGTVNRLMDDMEVSSGPVAGVRVVCRRWVRPKPGSVTPREIVFGVATRACRLQIENGDAFIVKHWDRQALAGVIDGLGHGEPARRAARVAREYIERHFDQPLENIFRGAGRACRATRGVVMALVRFDLKRRTATVANVGNVEVRILDGAERFDIVVRRGVVGLNAPDPVCREHPWSKSAILVMHSDGIRSRWNWNDFRDVANDRPDAIARRMLLELGSSDDDSTVLVARSAGQ